MPSERTESIQEEINRIFKSLIDLEFQIQKEIAELRESTSTYSADLQKKNETIKSKIQQLNKSIKEVKEFANSRNFEKEKQEIKEKLQIHISEEENLNNMLRKANIACTLNAKKAYEMERKALMEGGEEALLKRQQRTKQEMMKASQQLTDTLQRIRNRMHSETERNYELLTELGRSSRTIEDTISEQNSLGGSLRQGKSILAKKKRRDFTDKLLIFMAFGFFMLVVLYILKKRFPIWIPEIPVFFYSQ